MSSQPSQPCRRYVDMWAVPGMHASNVEFLQKLKTADTNHFNTHMDVVGTVSQQNRETEAWEKTHLIGLRSDVWKLDSEELEGTVDAMRRCRKQELKKQIKKHGRLDKKQQAQLEQQLAEDQVMKIEAGDIEKRRLVLKLFKTTTERMQWCGTIEQMTAIEIQHSIGSNRSLLAMAVMLPRTEMVTHVQQNHRTYRIPAVFSSGFFADGQMWSLILKRHWLSFGADFDIEVNGETIGDVDGRVFSLGWDSYINLDPHPLTENTRFVDLLTLFTASVGYHRAMRKSVGRRVTATLDGNASCNVMEDEEIRLMNNGRAAA